MALVLMVDDLVQGPEGILRGQAAAVGEAGVIAQMKGIEQAVCGDLPVLGQAGRRPTFGVGPGQGLVDVAHQGLVSGASWFGADVQGDGGLAGPDAYDSA